MELYIEPKLPERNPKTGQLNKGNTLAKGNTWDRIYDKDTRARQLLRLKELSRTKGLRTSNRPILCLNNNRIYDSAAMAGRELGIDPSHISSCCRGKRRTVKGYKFEYHYDE